MLDIGKEESCNGGISFSRYYASEEEEWDKRVQRLKQHETTWRDYKIHNSQDNRIHWNKKLKFKSKGVVKKFVCFLPLPLLYLGNDHPK
jgi:hypothetical protein